VNRFTDGSQIEHFVMAVTPARIMRAHGVGRHSPARENATGIINLSVKIGPKLLELLHELVPAARVIGLLVNQADTALAQVQLRAIQSAASTLGLELQVLNASTSYPVVSPYRELRSSLSDMRLSDLAVGSDSRNRTILCAFRSRTGRNQPSNSKCGFR
jgi:ABC-type uncharacterized transport system substrate-binding protein